MSEMSEFRVFSWRGRPVAAVEKAPGRLRRAWLGQYPAYTWRRKAWKSLLAVSLLVRADSLLSEDVADPRLHGFQLNHWVDALRGLLGEAGVGVGVAFRFPSQQDRGRLYATMYDHRSQPIAFAKIAAPQGEPERLHAEAEALREIAEVSGRKYRVPGLITHEEIDDCSVLLTQALPVSARAHPCRDQALPGFQVSESWRHVEPGEFDNLSWWPAAKKELTDDHTAFAKDLERYRAQGLEVGRAHGDFTPANLVIDHQTCWVYDWEQSQPDAPASTDVIGFFLGCRSRQALADPQQVMRQLRQRFFRGRGDSQQADAAFSLAYRLAYGSDDVKVLLKYWEPIT